MVNLRYRMDKLNVVCVLCVVTLTWCLDSVEAIPEYYVEDHCSQTLALNYGSIEAVKLRLTKTEKYPDGMRCAMRVQAPQGKRLFVRFETFDVQGIPDLMCQSGDYAQFFDGQNEQAPVLPGLAQRVCSMPESKKFTTSDRFLVLRFQSDTDKIAGRGIRLVVTAFSEGPCSKEQYQCTKENACIQKKLECDGVPSCPDGSDEAMPKCLSTAAIAGIAVGGGIVLIAAIVIIVIVCVRRERKRRARIIKRALENSRYPLTFWEPPESPGIDLSKIDPIWDGGLTDNHYNSAEELTLSPPKYSTGAYVHTGNMVRVMGPGGYEVNKVPSSFWDITLNDLVLAATSRTTNI